MADMYPIFLPKRERVVRCPCCGSSAWVKINRKDKPFLRCDYCGILIFANGYPSMRWLTNELQDYWEEKTYK